MNFHFSEEQSALATSLRSFLDVEVTADAVRELWETESGRSQALWSKLAGFGLLGLLVPEEHGGLGMSEVELVALLEETGRAALPAPVLETAAVAAPLLAGLGSWADAASWLEGIAAGSTTVAVGHPTNPFVADAHVADLLLLERDGRVHAVPRDEVELESQPANDPSRKIFRVIWTPREGTSVAAGEEARRLLGAAFDRGALAVAAQLVGIAQRLVELAVAYACEREQFGRPIGSFQAVKHMLADVQVGIEFARPALYRAAFSISHADPAASVHVSHAKVAASDVALGAARAALQVHGAIGYTWEADPHIWMRRAWALEAEWGSRLWHTRRVAAAVLDGDGGNAGFGFVAKPSEAGGPRSARA